MLGRRMTNVLDHLPAAVLAVAPHMTTGDLTTWVDALTPPMRSAGMLTPRRAAMFIGQCAVESARFTELAEDLNYSAKRLLQVWPARFGLHAAEPQRFAHNPQALANLVYADRLGNGSFESGDGWTFRGGGLIQLTGRDAYTRFGSSIHKTPIEAAAWVRTPPGAATSACWFWSANHLNGLADSWELTMATHIINGSSLGLADRLEACNVALKAFGGDGLR
jgi:putative chitinase